MIFSCIAPVFRAGSSCSKQMFLKTGKINSKINQPFKLQMHCYRTLPKAPPSEYTKAEALNAVFWWWVLWYFMVDYKEYFGVPPPDPSKWTDEELGIPPL